MATSIERTLSILAGRMYFERILADPSMPLALQGQAAAIAANLPSADTLEKHTQSRSPRIPPGWDVSFRAALGLLVNIRAEPSPPARTRYLARRLLRSLPDESMIRELSNPDSYLSFGPLLEHLNEIQMGRLQEWA